MRVTTRPGRRPTVEQCSGTGGSDRAPPSGLEQTDAMDEGKPGEQLRIPAGPRIRTGPRPAPRAPRRVAGPDVDPGRADPQVGAHDTGPRRAGAARRRPAPGCPDGVHRACEVSAAAWRVRAGRSRREGAEGVLPRRP